MDQPKKVILCVDDDAAIRGLYHGLLESNYRIVEAANRTEALRVLDQLVRDQSQPSLLITDCDMARPEEGIDLLKDVRKEYPTLCCLLTSGELTPEREALAMQCGAAETFGKPFNIRHLRLLVEKYAPA